MNKDLDYNYIAKDIAREIANSSIYDEQAIALKVKAILKASIEREPGDRDYSKLVIKLHRQTIALVRKDFEMNFWKNKVLNKELHYNELHELLKEKGL